MEYVNLAKYAKSIVDLLSFSYDKEYTNIEYEFDEEITAKFGLEKAIPLGLLENEVISHSFKYAFPDIRKGKLRCSTTKEGNNKLLLISDNGVGLPKNHIIGETNLLGMKLIQSLADQMEGTIFINRGI